MRHDQIRIEKPTLSAARAARIGTGRCRIKVEVDEQLGAIGEAVEVEAEKVAGSIDAVEKKVDDVAANAATSLLEAKEEILQQALDSDAGESRTSQHPLVGRHAGYLLGSYASPCAAFPVRGRKTWI